MIACPRPLSVWSLMLNESISYSGYFGQDLKVKPWFVGFKLSSVYIIWDIHIYTVGQNGGYFTGRGEYNNMGLCCVIHSYVNGLEMFLV